MSDGRAAVAPRRAPPRSHKKRSAGQMMDSGPIDSFMAPTTPGADLPWSDGSSTHMLQHDEGSNSWRPASIVKEDNGRVQVSPSGQDKDWFEWLPVKSPRLKQHGGGKGWKSNHDGTFALVEEGEPAAAAPKGRALRERPNELSSHGSEGHEQKVSTPDSGGGIFKSAAAAVLRQELRLMPTGEITKLALQRGLIKPLGKTPEATMASAMYTDVKKKEGKSLFIRPHEGAFGLREWMTDPDMAPILSGAGTASPLTPCRGSGVQPTKRQRSMLASKARRGSTGANSEDGGDVDDAAEESEGTGGEGHSPSSASRPTRASGGAAAVESRLEQSPAAAPVPAKSPNSKDGASNMEMMLMLLEAVDEVETAGSEDDSGAQEAAAAAPAPALATESAPAAAAAAQAQDVAAAAVAAPAREMESGRSTPVKALPSATPRATAHGTPSGTPRASPRKERSHSHGHHERHHGVTFMEEDDEDDIWAGIPSTPGPGATPSVAAAAAAAARSARLADEERRGVPSAPPRPPPAPTSSAANTPSKPPPAPAPTAAASGSPSAFGFPAPTPGSVPTSPTWGPMASPHRSPGAASLGWGPSVSPLASPLASPCASGGAWSAAAAGGAPPATPGGAGGVLSKEELEEMEALHGAHPMVGKGWLMLAHELQRAGDAAGAKRALDRCQSVYRALKRMSRATSSTPSNPGSEKSTGEEGEQQPQEQEQEQEEEKEGAKGGDAQVGAAEIEVEGGEAGGVAGEGEGDECEQSFDLLSEEIQRSTPTSTPMTTPTSAERPMPSDPSRDPLGVCGPRPGGDGAARVISYLLVAPPPAAAH